LSKIHKALEKAQREREGELKPDFLFVPPVAVETQEPSKRVPKIPRREGIVSEQKLITFYEPGSLAAEQFRKLRTKLLRLRVSQPPRTILVTSATSGEGKTLISANLAAGIAYDFNAYALLVDCDLRKSSLSHWFGLHEGFGLSDYLAGKKEIPELLLQTEVEKLKILLGGSIPDNPTELIASARMEALIQELKSRYHDRYVILDSPPLLSTSEPEILSRFVDGVIVVVRAGVTPRETLRQAISSLEKEKILGFVLNDLQLKSSGLSSRYFGSDSSYYGYGYGYGQTRKENKKGR